MKVLRIIDRLNVGGPAQHVAWLEAGCLWLSKSRQIGALVEQSVATFAHA